MGAPALATCRASSAKSPCNRPLAMTPAATAYTLARHSARKDHRRPQRPLACLSYRAACRSGADHRGRAAGRRTGGARMAASARVPRDTGTDADPDQRSIVPASCPFGSLRCLTIAAVLSSNIESPARSRYPRHRSPVSRRAVDAPAHLPHAWPSWPPTIDDQCRRLRPRQERGHHRATDV